MKEKILNVLSWVLAIFIMLYGLALFYISPIAAIIMIAVGMLFNPKIKKVIESKIHKSISFTIKQKVIIVFVSFIASFIFISTSNYAENSLKKQIDTKIKTMNSAINEGNAEKAIPVINELKLSSNIDAKNLATEAEKLVNDSASLIKVKEVLSNMSDEEFKMLQEGKLVKQFFPVKSLNDKFISLLKQNEKERIVLLETKKKEEELKKKNEEEAKVKAQKEERKKKITSQFSIWGGSHRTLEMYIKKSMNDPESYQHVETRYVDKGDYIFVMTTFRGKNAFGGVVKNSISANIDIDGNILKIIN